MDIKGKVISILPLVTGQGKNGTWKKQEFVIETLGTQYPKKVMMNLWGEKVDQNPLTVGEIITASFDLESREFNGRWYTDVRAWKIERENQASRPEMPATPGAYPPDFNQQEPDDLPF